MLLSAFLDRNFIENFVKIMPLTMARTAKEQELQSAILI